MKNKVVSAAEAIAIVHSGDTVAFSGFVGSGTPEELIEALQDRFLKTKEPGNLTLVFAAAPGDGEEKGLNRLAIPGLVKRAIGGHWGLIPKLADMAVNNEFEAYNLPLGVISTLFRDIAAHRAGLLTKIGMRTFVDPRQRGGKINARTTEDLVRLMEIDGEEWLFYKTFPINVAFIRGTTADQSGNITMEREALTLDNLAIATAAKNSNGFVIAQVERICASGSLNPRQVIVPGILVDCVVVAKPENHMQTYATFNNPAFSGELRLPLDSLDTMHFDIRKIIARRCAFELPMGGVVNLGIGMPEGVAKIAAEEKVLSYVTLTAEPGVIGGIPQSGADFGAAINTEAVLQQNQQFDFYDGGGLDMACLGMAQTDAEGNVNVSCFGKRLAGAGGFINISQSARKLVFAGTFTAGGLRVEMMDDELVIVKEGREKKFISKVDEITFNGQYAAETGQTVYYVTERCVFRRTLEGMELIEVAPGIDIDRHILAHMEFVPIIREPKTMDLRIFQNFPMHLDETLLSLGVTQRLSYDLRRNTVFCNWEGLHVRNRDDVDRVRRAIEDLCQSVGRKVNFVANYDGFRIDPGMEDTYAAMVRYLETHYYLSASRYTTSAFLRLKLGEALERRKVAPHIFETGEEASAFIETNNATDSRMGVSYQFLNQGYDE